MSKECQSNSKIDNELCEQNLSARERQLYLLLKKFGAKTMAEIIATNISKIELAIYGLIRSINLKLKDEKIVARIRLSNDEPISFHIIKKSANPHRSKIDFNKK